MLQALITIESPEPAGDAIWHHPGRPLRLRGWAIAREGVRRVNLYVDGKFVGAADYGRSRPDVARNFPGWRNAASSGFACRLNVLPEHCETTSIGIEVVTALGGLGRRNITIARCSDRDQPAALPSAPANEASFAPTVWRSAFTAHMAPGDTAANLHALESASRLTGDVVHADHIVKVGAALNLLRRVWAGQSTDPLLRAYLADLGYCNGRAGAQTAFAIPVACATPCVADRGKS